MHSSILPLPISSGKFIRGISAPIALLAAILPCNGRADGWTLKQGQWQIITTASYYGTDHYRDADGNSRNTKSFSKSELNPYIEYGLRDDLTLGLNTSFQYFDQPGNGIGSSPLSRMHNVLGGVTELFARKRLWQNGHSVLAVQPLVRLPDYYTDTNFIAHERSSWDGELSLQGAVGKPFNGFPSFASASLGYRKRFGEPDDQVRLTLAAGSWIWPKFMVMGQAFGTWGIGSGGQAVFTNFGSDDYDLVKLQLSGVYRFNENLALQMGGFRNVYARNSGEGGGVLMALWWRF